MANALLLLLLLLLVAHFHQYSNAFYPIRPPFWRNRRPPDLPRRQPPGAPGRRVGARHRLRRGGARGCDTHGEAPGRKDGLSDINVHQN